MSEDVDQVRVLVEVKELPKRDGHRTNVRGQFDEVFHRGEVGERFGRLGEAHVANIVQRGSYRVLGICNSDFNDPVLGTILSIQKLNFQNKPSTPKRVG